MPLHDQLDSHTRALCAQIPGIRDGSATAVHDARVAIRRIRALLPVVHVTYPEIDVDGAERTARRLARALGRVRDRDVAMQLCDAIDRAAPHLSAVAALLRRDLRTSQARARRRLVKAVDAAHLEVLDELTKSTPRLRRLQGLTGRGHAHGHALRAMARDQAESVRCAVKHASGVYFPRRAHGARVEIKKLRYIVESMAASPGGARGVKPLKRAQEVLGALHDREVLRNRVERVGEDAAVPRHEVEAFTAYLDAECDGLFARYLCQRPAILEICHALRAGDAAARRDVAVAVGAVAGVAAIAVPAAAGWFRRARRDAIPTAARLQLAPPAELKAR